MKETSLKVLFIFIKCKYDTYDINAIRGVHIFVLNQFWGNEANLLFSQAERETYSQMLFMFISNVIPHGPRVGRSHFL